MTQRFEVQLARDQPVRWYPWRSFATLQAAREAIALCCGKHERTRIVVVPTSGEDAAQPEGN